MLTLPLILSAASLALAAPSNPQRRSNDPSGAPIAVASTFATGFDPAIATATTIYAISDGNSPSVTLIASSWSASPTMSGENCGPATTVTMLRTGAVATATAVGTSWAGSSDDYSGSSAQASSWISSAETVSSGIDTAYTGWVDPSGPAAEPATSTVWPSAGSGSAEGAYTTVIASSQDYASVSGYESDAQAVYTTIIGSSDDWDSASGSAVQVATSTAWADNYSGSVSAIQAASSTWVASGPIAVTSSLPASGSGAVVSEAMSTASVSTGYVTATAYGCAPTVTVWVDAVASSTATASGFIASTTRISTTISSNSNSNNGSSSGVRAEAQQAAKPASAASSTIISSGAAVFAVGAAALMF